MLSRLTLAAVLTPIVLTLASVAAAAEYEVTSKTGQGEMYFEPEVLRIAPGDTVRFTVAHTGVGHDAASIRGMIPEGAEPFMGEPDEELSITFTVPGVYGIKCGPHYSAYGMVG
ncbi:MAG: plastocyanin/azurin family copper-binding protein, partial [Devosia sp.]